MSREQRVIVRMDGMSLLLPGYLTGLSMDVRWDRRKVRYAGSLVQFQPDISPKPLWIKPSEVLGEEKGIA